MKVRPKIKRVMKDVLVREAAALGNPADSQTVCPLGCAALDGGGASLVTGAKDMVELFAPLRGLNLDFERDRQ